MAKEQVPPHRLAYRGLRRSVLANERNLPATLKRMVVHIQLRPRPSLMIRRQLVQVTLQRRTRRRRRLRFLISQLNRVFQTSMTVNLQQVR